MTNNIAVITTFANQHFEPYAKEMLQSFVKYWPTQVSLFVQLDDELLLPVLKPMLRQVDFIGVERSPEHIAFVERHKGKDHPTDYRMQPVRFCHKVFAIKNTLDSIRAVKAEGGAVPRYLIWMDADVHTIRPVTMDDIKACLPKEGDAVAYLGRRDWDHSECGWLAFDLENGGDNAIDWVANRYIDDGIFNEKQQHDSWMWDVARALPDGNVWYTTWTNLTPHAAGRDVWQQSPMGAWSVHYKGPQAKAQLAGVPIMQQPMPPAGPQRIQVRTKNAIPNADICRQIEKNQQLIKNWVKPCTPVDEELCIVSAGPMLVAEDVRKEIAAGKRVVAVKNALVPLKKAGITPWACILLDPRPHVADFVQDADPSITWFVASQVNPAVTLELLARGCTVWGYHAAVNAGEEPLILKQEGAVISGGSATATRGLYLLHHLGFSRFTLYGYELSMPDKPDFNATTEITEDDGRKVQMPKYMEMTVETNDPFYNQKRMFWTEPQYFAQFEEMNEMIKGDKFKFTAQGEGVVPFMIRAKQIGNMRREEARKKIMGDKPVTYLEMLTQ